MRIFTKCYVAFFLLFLANIYAQNAEQLNWEVSVDKLKLSELSFTTVNITDLEIDNTGNSYVSASKSIADNHGSFFKRYNQFGQFYPFTNWELTFEYKGHATAGIYTNGDLALNGFYDPWNYWTEVFVARIDSSGGIIWQHTSATTVSDGDDFRDSHIQFAMMDAEQNLYIAGRFGSRSYHRHDFTLSGDTLLNGWGLDIFMAKFSPQGQLLWLKRIERDIQNGQYYQVLQHPHEEIESFSVSRDGEINIDYVFHEFIYVVSDTSTAETVIPETNYSAQFNAAGTLIWQKEGDWPGEISWDADKNICRYALKNFSDSVTVGDRKLVSDGGIDFYFAKYTLDGDLHWLIHEGDSGDETARDYTLDSAGDLIIAGDFTDVFNTGGNMLACADSSDIFIIKYDKNQQHLWAVSHHAFSVDETETAARVRVDDSGLVFLAGSRTYENVNEPDALKKEFFLTRFIVKSDAESMCNFKDSFETAAAENWQELNPQRWQIVAEGDSQVYSIITTNYLANDNDALGELSVLAGQSYGDFRLTCLARSDEDVATNTHADYAFVFA